MIVQQIEYNKKELKAVQLAPPEARINLEGSLVIDGADLEWDYDKFPYGPGTLGTELQRSGKDREYIENCRNNWALVDIDDNGNIGDIYRLSPRGLYKVSSTDFSNGTQEFITDNVNDLYDQLKG